MLPKTKGDFLLDFVLVLSYEGAIGKDLTYQTYIWNAHNFTEVVFSVYHLSIFHFCQKCGICIDGKSELACGYTHRPEAVLTFEIG